MKLYRIVGWLLAIAMLFAIHPLDQSLQYDRLVLGLRQPTPWFQIVARASGGDTELAVTGVTGVIVGAALGGFREVAASMLWMKTHEYWHKGHGTQAKALWLMRLVTLLDPHWLEPWRITAWHLAYNLYVETDDPALQAKYLQMGVECLKEGISWNPDRYDLYLELGWTLFDKVKDYEEAPKWFRAAMRYPHPEYVDRLVGHAYERMPDIPRALDAYDYCMKRNPLDQTAVGATLTIRERYLPAWDLAEQGSYDEALDYVEEARRRMPQNDSGQNNLLLLGMASAFEQGDTAKAMAYARQNPHFHNRTEIQLEDLLPLHSYHWGIFLRRDSLAYFRRLVQAYPARGDLLNNVAWILATAEWSPALPQEVLAIAERAQALAPAPHPVLLDTLAVAQANAGDFEAAVHTAEQALALVPDHPQQARFRQQLQARIDLYRNRQPYREEAAARLF